MSHLKALGSSYAPESTRLASYLCVAQRINSSQVTKSHTRNILQTFALVANTLKFHGGEGEKKKGCDRSQQDSNLRGQSPMDF